MKAAKWWSQSIEMGWRSCTEWRRRVSRWPVTADSRHPLSARAAPLFGQPCGGSSSLRASSVQWPVPSLPFPFSLPPVRVWTRAVPLTSGRFLEMASVCVTLHDGGRARPSRTKRGLFSFRLTPSCSGMSTCCKGLWGFRMSKTWFPLQRGPHSNISRYPQCSGNPGEGEMDLASAVASALASWVDSSFSLLFLIVLLIWAKHLGSSIGIVFRRQPHLTS